MSKYQYQGSGPNRKTRSVTNEQFHYQQKLTKLMRWSSHYQEILQSSQSIIAFALASEDRIWRVLTTIKILCVSGFTHRRSGELIAHAASKAPHSLQTNRPRRTFVLKLINTFNKTSLFIDFRTQKNEQVHF